MVMPDDDLRASHPSRRGAAPGSGAKVRPMGLLDALCEATFVRRSDGRVHFFPWGAAGRGYALACEGEHRRLRRKTKRLLALGLLGCPLVAAFGMEPLGLRAMAAFGLLLGLFGVARLAWLTRGLERSPERITRAEASSRIARALRRLWKGDGAAS
jgi:hypothetical protein